jgi:dienelactone hydrolase
MPGPFPTTTDKNVGPNNGYTVYRPQTLGQNGFLHAPIIFGPGIGMQSSQLSTLLLSFASHGFLVVGTPVLNEGPGGAQNLKSMTDGLNWILAQNTTAGSPYQGKLDVTHAISMGYSVGGTSAVQLGGHAAVATTVSIHGHTASSNMHGPLLQTSGTADTVGLPLQMMTYQMSQVQTFLGTVNGADHGYIQQIMNGQQGGVERPRSSPGSATGSTTTRARSTTSTAPIASCARARGRIRNARTGPPSDRRGTRLSGARREAAVSAP